MQVFARSFLADRYFFSTAGVPHLNCGPVVYEFVHYCTCLYIYVFFWGLKTFQNCTHFLSICVQVFNCIHAGLIFLLWCSDILKCCAQGRIQESRFKDNIPTLKIFVIGGIKSFLGEIFSEFFRSPVKFRFFTPPPFFETIFFFAVLQGLTGMNGLNSQGRVD